MIELPVIKSHRRTKYHIYFLSNSTVVTSAYNFVVRNVKMALLFDIKVEMNTWIMMAGFPVELKKPEQ